MNLFSFLPGSLTVELTCADPEMALRLFSNAGISISKIHRRSELTLRCTLSRKHYPHLTAISKKEGYSLKILEKRGLYWDVQRSIQRPVLLGGLLLLFLFCVFLPTRILFIEVEGNQQLPDKQILSAAQDCGITFGASRVKVRSEKVKNKLLSRLPELQWVGVNTSGCVATVSVRERATPESSAPEPAVSSIVADRDGFLLSVTVTSGNPLCRPGQYVQEGQILVSGYTDCGLFIQAAPAEAEILAQTTRHLDVIKLNDSMVRGKITDTKHRYSLLVGKKRINLWKDSGIWDSTCGRIYEEKYATLPGGFRLPIALCVEEYSFSPLEFQSDADTGSLSQFAQDYLPSQMNAGRILSEDEQFSCMEGVTRLEGEYTCQEMIGRVKTEQIGE